MRSKLGALLSPTPSSPLLLPPAGISDLEVQQHASTRLTSSAGGCERGGS